MKWRPLYLLRTPRHRLGSPVIPIEGLPLVIPCAGVAGGAVANTVSTHIYLLFSLCGLTCGAWSCSGNYIVLAGKKAVLFTGSPVWGQRQALTYGYSRSLSVPVNPTLAFKFSTTADYSNAKALIT
jgi:hypothetical protein